MQEPNTYDYLAGLDRLSEALDRAMSRVADSDEQWAEQKARLRAEDRWSELLYN